MDYLEDSKLIDSLEGQLAAEEEQQLQMLLAKDAALRERYAQLKTVLEAIKNSAEVPVPASLANKFNNMLQEEIRQQRNDRTIPLQTVYRLAAAVALILAGTGLGLWLSGNTPQNDELAELRKEMEQTKAVMNAMLANQQSASQRMMGVQAALQLPRADNELVATLTRTLNEDPNVNVRLAALDALGKFHDNPQVSTSLIQSLPQQKDPVVQIALIRLLVQLRQKGAVNELENIIRNNLIIKPVKDEAYSGLLKLS